MKKTIIGAFAGLALAACPNVIAQQSSANQVILSFHTNIYDNAGEANAFHFELGATEDIYVDVDCGYGLTEMEVKQATVGSSGISGSVFSGSVSAAGNVTVYGDPSKIDYVMLEGLYMSTVDLSNLTNVEILNICYNDLESLDLSHMHKLMALYADGLPCNKTPLIIGPDKPDLAILSMSMVDNVDPNFDLRQYPNLQSFVAYSSPTLLNADPTNCPKLLQYSIDGAAVSSVDFSNNPELLVINVSNTRITSVDLSACPNLTEFYGTHTGVANGKYQFSSIDVSKNPNLQRLFLSDNNLTSLDLSNNDVLTDLYVSGNYFTEMDLSLQTRLINVNVANNYLWYSKLPKPAYADYIYYQRNMPVNRSYKVGDVIDFSDKVLRDGTTTTCTLVSLKSSDPRVQTPVDAAAYTYADGKLTLNQALGDSVMAVFSNSLFNAYNLQTAPFLIKSAEEFGKPSAKASLRFAATESALNFAVGIEGATATAPKEFFVDFGNGTLVPFKATAADLSAGNNVSGTRSGTVTIYTAEGDFLTAVGVDSQRLLNVDFQNARLLKTLSLTNCQLPSIVLQYNRYLSDLNLSGNSLTTISLRGANELFAKNGLYNINLANNQLTSIDTESVGCWRSLNVANNKLTTVPQTEINDLEELDISGNLFDEFSFRDCESLRVFKAAGNNLSVLEIPDYVPFAEVDLSMNNFTFETLPATGTFPKYTYAPQKQVQLPESAPTVSLYTYLQAANGTATQFNWFYASDNSAVPAGMIDMSNGRFTFTDADMAAVYCAMTNAAFPAFTGENALRTSVVKPSGAPEYVWATFKTAQTGIGEIVLLTNKPGTDVYIDWAGDGVLEPYMLDGQRNIFEVPVTAGAEVKCYSLTAEPALTGVSFGVGNLSQADFSPLTKLTFFSLMGSKIGDANIKLPEAPSMSELRLQNADLTTIAPIATKYPRLTMLDVSFNDLKTLDVTSFKSLALLYAAYSNLDEVTLDNPRLWNLELSGNNLDHIDLSKVPALDQIFLLDNKFRTLDLSQAPLLEVVYINNNYFDFTTLPADNGYKVYEYANQAEFQVEPKDGIVDLSSQLKIGDYTTTYTWYDGNPGLDTEGNFNGTPLAEDYFTIKDGVTTFLKDAYGVVCVMQNEAFPKLALMTPMLDVTAAGVADVTIDATGAARVDGNNIVVRAAQGTPVTLTDLGGHVLGTADGNTTFGPLATGVYIARVGADTFKLLVK